MSYSFKLRTEFPHVYELDIFFTRKFPRLKYLFSLPLPFWMLEVNHAKLWGNTRWNPIVLHHFTIIYLLLKQYQPENDLKTCFSKTTFNIMSGKKKKRFFFFLYNLYFMLKINKKYHWKNTKWESASFFTSSFLAELDQSIL